MAMHGARRRAGRVAAGVATGIALIALTSCHVSWPWRSGESGGTTGSEPASADASRGSLNDRVPLSETDPTLRVRVITDAKTVEIGGPRFVILSVPGRPEAPITVRTPVTLTAESRQWIAAPSHTTASTLARRNAPGFDVLNIEAVGGGEVAVNGVRFPGSIRLHGRDDRMGGSGSAGSGAAATPASFDVVEEVSVEAYLPGVVTKEMYPGWHPQAYRAQAIAARSYALHERARRRSIGSSFDLENTQQDQVYAGTTTDPAAIEAVSSTRGLVVAQNGRLIRAYYSSTCGDRAGSARDTWPTGPGFEFNLAEPIQAYERVCPCDRSPRHRWSVTRSRTELTQRIRGFAAERGMGLRDLKSIASITATGFNTVGRPSRYTVTDTDGRTWELSAEDLRLACNHPGPAAAKLPAIEFSSRVLSGDIAFNMTGDSVIINGRGFGHAVGMCQFGAQSLAQQGEKGEKIVEHYYKGARVTKAY